MLQFFGMIFLVVWLVFFFYIIFTSEKPNRRVRK